MNEICWELLTIQSCFNIKKTKNKSTTACYIVNTNCHLGLFIDGKTNTLCRHDQCIKTTRLDT